MLARGLMACALCITAGAAVILTMERQQDGPPQQDTALTQIPVFPTAGATAIRREVAPLGGWTFSDGSVIVALGQEARAKNLHLQFEETPPDRIPPLPGGYSQPIRFFRISVYGPEGRLWLGRSPLPATISMLLNQRDHLIADGDPFRFVVQRYDETSSSWTLVPSSLDLPWIRAKVNIYALGLFTTVAILDEGEIDQRNKSPANASRGGALRIEHITPLGREGPSPAAPIPVSSPTETPRPRPSPMVRHLTPTVTPTPTAVPTSPPAATATRTPTLIPPPSPVPSPPPTPDPTSTETPSPAHTPSATPALIRGYRLFINGRQVLARDVRFLVPLGVVTLDKLPESSGTYPPDTGGQN